MGARSTRSHAAGHPNVQPRPSCCSLEVTGPPPTVARWCSRVVRDARRLSPCMDTSRSSLDPARVLPLIARGIGWGGTDPRSGVTLAAHGRPSWRTGAHLWSCRAGRRGGRTNGLLCRPFHAARPARQRCGSGMAQGASPSRRGIRRSGPSARACLHGGGVGGQRRYVERGLRIVVIGRRPGACPEDMTPGAWGSETPIRSRSDSVVFVDEPTE